MTGTQTFQAIDNWGEYVVIIAALIVFGWIATAIIRSKK